MAAAFMGGMAQGINSGINLYQAIEGKKHRDRMFEYQQNRDKTADQQFNTQQRLAEKQFDTRQELAEKQADRMQERWETGRADKELDRRFNTFRSTMNGQLSQFVDAPDKQREFIRDHSDDLAEFINAGYIAGAGDFQKRIDNGYEFAHFTPVDGGYAVALRNKETGEIAPMTQNASSDPNDPVSVFSFNDLAHGVSDGGYANVLRARDTYAYIVGELQQAGSQDFGVAEARLAQIDAALAKLENNEPLTGEDEQVLEEAKVTHAQHMQDTPGAPEPPGPNSWASQIPGKPQGGLAGAGRRLNNGRQEASPLPNRELSPKEQRGQLNEAIGDTAVVRGIRSGAGAATDGVKTSLGAIAQGWASTFQGDKTPSRPEEGGEPSASATEQQPAPNQERQRLEQDRQRITQSLDSLKAGKESLSQGNWRTFAKRHGISLADPESSKQVMNALRNGGAGITDEDRKALAKEQRKQVREFRSDTGKLTSDLLGGLPAEIKEQDGFNRNEWDATITKVLQDFGPDVFYDKNMDMAMMKQAVAQSRDATEVMSQLYGMGHGVPGDVLYQAVDGWGKATQRAPTPEEVDKIARHLKAGGHMSDFKG